jgi:DNA-binding response OmpR family regulator
LLEWLAMTANNAELRILIIEDHAALARCIAEALKDFGCVVVGLVADLKSALQAVQQGGFDVAVLDWTLRGEEAAPVADALLAGGCPFLVTSGHRASTMPRRVRQVPFLQKPFTMCALNSAIKALVSRSC